MHPSNSFFTVLRSQENGCLKRIVVGNTYFAEKVQMTPRYRGAAIDDSGFKNKI